MKKQSGISMMALIITIIIIIILSVMLISGMTASIKKSSRMNAIEEFRNVQEVILRQRARMLTGEYTPSMTAMSDMEVDEFFKDVTDSNYIDSIENVKSNIKNTNSIEKEPLHIYYKLTPEIFKKEYANDVTVKNIKRDYVVNFGLNTVISIYDGEFNIATN